MEIVVEKQRRKTIVLKILDSTHAQVKVPYGISNKKIKEFVESKQEWIAKQLQKMKCFEDFQKTFDFEKYVYVDGKVFMQTKDLAFGFENMSKLKKKQIVRNFYLSHFHVLKEIAENVSNSTGLKCKEILPMSSVRVWGSFNVYGQMKLNLKLIVLPKELAYYVICHEFCHSVHMNHKPKFWANVSKICPNYKILKNELSRFSFVLKLNF